MQLKHHAMIGAALSVALLPSIGPVATTGFLTASILIDLDHYLDFLIHNRFRSFSIKKMFLYHKYLFPRIKNPEFLSLEIFHTLEFLAVAAALSIWSRSILLQAATIGMIVHCLCDILYLKRHGAFSSRAHSSLEYLFRKRKMLRQGLRLERPYQEVLELIEAF